jgi:hypothetical protein
MSKQRPEKRKPVTEPDKTKKSTSKADGTVNLSQEELRAISGGGTLPPTKPQPTP